MKRASLVIFIGSLLAASAALATTYVRVEKDGTKTYSDRPLPGGQPVDIAAGADLFGAAAPHRGPHRVRPKNSAAGCGELPLRSCALTPRADETFQNPETVDAERGADSGAAPRATR